MIPAEQEHREDEYREQTACGELVDVRGPHGTTGFALADEPPQSFRLVIDMLGRPFLTNAAHKLHPKAVTRIRGTWKDCATTLARAQRIPTLEAIAVTAWAQYPDRRSLPDADGTAPSVKGVIDGLVAAQVIPDDGPDYVHEVRYLRPRVEPGCNPGLVVEITGLTR